jgi:hypothetical protein
MAVSGFGLKGLSDGLLKGMRAGRAMDDWAHQDKQREREEKVWAREDELADLNMTLKKYELEELHDAEYREQFKRNARFLRYALDQSTNPETRDLWKNKVLKDPVLQRELKEAWQVVSRPIVERGGPQGARKRFAGFTPLEDGRLVPRIEVQREDGESYVAPMTRNRDDDPGDEVMAFTPAQLAGNLAMGEAMAERLDALSILAGDTTPIEQAQAERERQREQQATQAERAFELKKLDIDHQQDLGLTRLESQLRTQRESTASEAEQAFDLKRLEREYELRAGLERTKGELGTSDSRPAMVQTVEWIADNLTGGNMERAWRLAQQSKSNPQELAAKLFLAEKKKAEETLSNVSDEVLWQRVESAMKGLRESPVMNPLQAREPAQSPARGQGLGALDTRQPAAAAPAATFQTPEAVNGAAFDAVRQYVERASAEELNALPANVRSAIHSRLTGGE